MEEALLLLDMEARTSYTTAVQVIRTIRCKLSIPVESIPALNELFSHYAKACTKIAQWGRDNREKNAIRLHHALYYDVRKEFNLPANLAITALRRCAGTLKTAKLKGKFDFRPTFVALDARTFTLKGESISWSMPGKKRMKAGLDIGDYQREALTGYKPTSATLIKAKSGYFINIQIKSEVPDAVPGGVLGVDLGIRNIAATSSGTKFDGKLVREFRTNRWRIRASLQSKGSRGAKKVLRQLSGYERRRATHRNHEIAKDIVGEAIKAGCSLIRMENLKGIRKRTKVPNRHLNRMVSLWSFGQLQQFVRYKAAMHGITVELVNPAYTSQTCSGCGKRGLRDREVFTCTTCDITLDADINAARNIAGGGVVNRPELTTLRKHG